MSQRNSRKENEDFSFEIIRHYGVLSSSPRGWTRELNYVKWNDREPKFDIRDWQPDHKKMSKGITLSEGEMAELIRIIKEKAIDPVNGVVQEEEALQPEASESEVQPDDDFCTQTS